MATPLRGLYKTQLELGARDVYGPALSHPACASMELQ